MSGGLKALQTLSIVAGFPFMILMIFMAVGLYRGLQREIEELDLEDAAFRRRLEALLAESDATRHAAAEGQAGKEPPSSEAERE